ncbi:MAG: hypothetical protein WEB79_08240 [Thermoleophilaceae bacterium]
MTAPTHRERRTSLRSRAMSAMRGVGPTARMRRRGRTAAFTGRQLARHPQPLIRGARAVDWPAVVGAASAVATIPRRRRRRRTRRPAAIGAAGLAGACAAGMAIRRSRAASDEQPTTGAAPGERSDRETGGPTAAPEAAQEPTTGGAPGTKPSSGFEPHT